MTISAAPPGKNVSYFHEEARGVGQFIVHSQDYADRWLDRNATHFLKIVIPCQPSADVFRLTNA